MNEKKGLKIRKYFKGKAGLYTTMLITSFATILFAFLFTEVIHATGKVEFCSSCHEMGTFVETYERDTHGGANKVGVKADCTSCHLPQDSQIDHVATKVVSGTKEVVMHITGNYSEKKYYDNRKNREDFVYSSGCISCHQEIESGKVKTDNEKAKKMHTYYLSKKGTDIKIECVSCHTDVGHNGELRKELIDMDTYPNEKQKEEE
ncbi:NapC/NirT family cytochrome c [Bacillus sp. Bva_UNVM-123]|uniref:cytochrome c3 family protein n=1 Tax=Bacillus sp. Bva_UNVM-123 TaxID=2829798 RepID=UPI00391F7113